MVVKGCQLRIRHRLALASPLSPTKIKFLSYGVDLVLSFLSQPTAIEEVLSI